MGHVGLNFVFVYSCFLNFHEFLNLLKFNFRLLNAHWLLQFGIFLAHGFFACGFLLVAISLMALSLVAFC